MNSPTFSCYSNSGSIKASAEAVVVVIVTVAATALVVIESVVPATFMAVVGATAVV